MRYARLARDPELMGCAVEMRFWAEVKLGEELAELKVAGEMAKGGGDQKSNHRGKKYPSDIPTLAEQGIDKNLAKRVRQRAAIPEDDRIAAVDTIIAKNLALLEGDKELLAAIRAEKNAGKREARALKEEALATNITALPDERLGVIYADPPWKFEFFSDAGANYVGPENHLLFRINVALRLFGKGEKGPELKVGAARLTVSCKFRSTEKREFCWCLAIFFYTAFARSLHGLHGLRILRMSRAGHRRRQNWLCCGAGSAASAACAATIGCRPRTLKRPVTLVTPITLVPKTPVFRGLTVGLTVTARNRLGNTDHT